jgi:UDP-glucose 4-epimerase
MKNKKILITGICGFIGRNLATKLSAKNEIIGIDNFEYSARDFCGDLIERITFVEGDVSRKETLKKVPTDLDYILHFGSPSSIILFNRKMNHCYRETVLSFLNIFEFAKKFNVRKVVFPSSGSIYAGNNQPHVEHIYPKPRNMYAAAKMACEGVASAYKDFVDSVGLRIFAGYGPGEERKRDFASVVYLFINAVSQNINPVIFGKGNQTRDFVFIDDVINATIKSIGINYTGIINVGSGIPTTFNFLLETINNVLGKAVEPKNMLKEKNYVENICADTEIMKNVLEIKPTPLKAGIERFCEYLNLL